MTNVIDQIAAGTKRDDLPEFRAGDTLKVDVKVVEGNRSRIQAGACALGSSPRKTREAKRTQPAPGTSETGHVSFDVALTG